MTRDARSNIFPVLRYRDARAAIDWLVGAFGFETKEVHEGPDGSIAHAELRFGPGVLGLSSAATTPGSNPWTTVRQGVYARVADVDAHHDRARAAGADVVMPPTDLDYGSREYSARDLGGHLWGFGTYDMGEAPGEQNLFVGLHYPDGPAALDWLQKAFGLVKTLEVPGPDGSILHAELRFGDGVLMMGSAPHDQGFWGDDRQCLSVRLDDPDAHHARAKAAGASIVQGPQDTPYGARGYFVRDLEGFLWGFSTYRPGSPG
jgi:uncharacterized glyoxalase superfamily protein PhnB